MTDSSKRSISDVNKSNSQAKKAYKNGQGCSLLCHPFGLMLLQYYRKTLLPRATEDIAANDADNLYNDLLVGLEPQLTELLQAQFSGASVATESAADSAADGTAADANCAGNNSSECGRASSGKSKKSELDFTKALAGIFNEHFRNNRHCRPPLVAEHQRRGEGQVSNCWAQSTGSGNTALSGGTQYGNCDIAFSTKVDGDHTDNEENNETKEIGESSPGDVVGILEVSLNENCGLRKVTQALDYATTMCKRDGDTADFAVKEYVVIWTLHLSSNVSTNQPESNNKEQKLNQGQEQQGQQPTPSEQKRAKIQDMEVRVYLGEISWDTQARTQDGKYCLRSKYAKIWREYTVISDGTSVDTEKVQEEEQRFHQQAKLQEGVRSIARAVAMVAKLAEWKNDRCHEQIFEKWELKGPYCAKVSFRSDGSDGSDCADPDKQHFMFKVFDNRFTPLPMSPYMWCDDTLCDRRLEVVPYFLLHEGCVDGSTPFEKHSYDYQEQNQGAYQCGDINKVKEIIRFLSEDGRGNMIETNTTSGNESRDTRVVPLLGNRCPCGKDTNYTVPFGQGTVVILRYKYIEGSHLPGYLMTITGDASVGGAEAGARTNTFVPAGAAKNAGGDERSAKSERLGSPRCFLPILNQLKIIHEKGYVHGDVRLLNMIFEKSLQPGEEGRAVLLDYDLGGKEGVRTYPEGYRQHLSDVGKRAGKGGEQLSRCDDLADLISVLQCFHLEADCLSALQFEIWGWKKEKERLARCILGLTDEVPGYEKQEMSVKEVQEMIDRLGKHYDIVSGLVKKWEERLLNLEEIISEEQGKRKSAPDLTDILRRLESLLTLDEEVKRECGELDPGFHLVFLRKGDQSSQENETG